MRSGTKMSCKQIPNIITFLNLLCGVLSIISTYNGEHHLSAALILVSSLFDCIDGKIACKLNAVSHFGKELDSLSDLVSFGVAPAILVYSAYLKDLGLIGLVFALTYIMCGAFRLARFNVKSHASHFTGLPIPIAGATIATVRLCCHTVPEWVFPVLVVVLSVLMVSKVRFPSIKV